MSIENATARRVRRDARGQLSERKTAKGTVYGLRFALPDRDEGGKPRRGYETLGRSWEGCDRREAERRAEELLARVRLGQYRTREEIAGEKAQREAARTTTPTFAAFSAEWFDRRVAVGGRRGRGLSESGRADLSWRLAHLNGWFGGMRLDEISEEEVERFATAKAAADRRAEGLSAASVNKCLSTAESVLAVAVRWRRIDRNPFTGYRLAAPKRRAVHLDRAAQVVALLDAAGEMDRERRLGRGHGRALLATLVFGGLRINEALSLTWRDVNLADGWLKVREGKTENATRTVYLYPPLRSELVALKARRDPDRDALVFPTAAGTKDTDGNVSRRLLRPAVERANERLDRIGEEMIPAAVATPGNRGGRTDGLTLHGLRHTYASAVLALGEDAGYVADQLGHADAGFTYSRYRKAMQRRDGERERLKALFEGEPVVLPDPPAAAVSVA